ncbi:invasin domain 3-containing protein [Streptomyces dangxiongensis]|uniref:invasin domain 3-containing protein n=1 Tax=Streptomyces dangxiongensis TaxID=1442032 RepID=UPI0026C79402
MKASFFGAVDTAGFPKDMYHLFRSQWTDEPMVHLLPMTWNREFDAKKTTDGRAYLETTEATGDDRTFTDGPYPGSYTSPNGSAGKLHLTWHVPYRPGELRAVARQNGEAVATDVLRTAGSPHAVRLTADRDSLAADGRSLAFVTADIVDAHGVTVPGALHLISFDVTGGRLAGVDNGRQESAERYQASTRTAFHGKALAIVRSGTEPGTLKVTARVDGLRPDTARLHTTPARRAVTTAPAPFRPDHPAPPDHPRADAGYSGRRDTLPAAMLDGDPATGWSNAFTKPATALLPAFGGARAEDWVSVDFGRRRTFDHLAVSFTTDAAHTLPARAEVAVWDGHAYLPVTGARTRWATGSDSPTVITFDAVRGSRLRLTLTSAHPGRPEGAVRISRLDC